MIITHNMQWNKCLSHEIWPKVKSGWADEFKNINFMWGLGENNIPKLNKIMANNEEWWYVDIGYMTGDIVRYPEPKIVDTDKTYFRIVKNNFHTVVYKNSDNTRYHELIEKNIDCKFKGWKENGNYILVCPSSETVSRVITGMSMDDWTNSTIENIRKYTDMEIRIRLKPRPNNQFWNTDIKDDMKNCYATVTCMSLAAIDSIIEGIPNISYQNNSGYAMGANAIKNIKSLNKPSDKEVNKWLSVLANNQFTLKEIKNGTAHKVLKKNYGI